MTHLPVPSHYLAVQFPKIKSKIPACLLSLTCLRPLQFLWFGDCLTARISNQSILKISPGCSLEEMMLKLKLQYFGHLTRRVDSLEKTLMLGGVGGRRRRGWQRMRWLDCITNWWMWVWLNSGSWWWTGRPGMLWFVGSQRVGHDWATELNWTEGNISCKDGLNKRQKWYGPNRSRRY